MTTPSTPSTGGEDCRECRKSVIIDLDRARAEHALFHGFPWWHRMFCRTCRATRVGA